MGTFGLGMIADRLADATEADVRALLGLAAMNSFASASVLSFLYRAPMKPLT